MVFYKVRQLTAIFVGMAAALTVPPIHAVPKTVELPVETFRDRLRGGWAGQMIGVSYGSVYEFRSLGQPILSPIRDWKPEYVENSIHQDDVYVEMTFLKTLEAHGIRPTLRQAGLDFRDSKYDLWHANMAARENLKQGIMPPLSGHPRYNPHADDIDFQIEADLFGLVSPGMPRAAARFSDLFGSIMNYGDGVYGGRFVTAMYSRAYLEKEPTHAAVGRCIRAGLAAIPARSKYAQALRDVIRGYKLYPGDWRKTWDLLQHKWGRDDLCPDGYKQPFNIDAKLNGAYVALGLLYGGGDFGKTLEITTRCGQDADCNPSTAAGVLGAITGFARIPKPYTAGIPALSGTRFEYTDYDYPHLVAASERVARKIVADEGGRVIRRNGREVMLLPVETPLPPKTLEQTDRFGIAKLRAWAADFAARREKARLSQLVESWAPGWKLVACGAEMNPGVGPLLGRSSALTTHPVSVSAPAILEKRVAVPRRNPRLNLLVTSYAGDPAADWELRAFADGKLIDRRIVHSPGEWAAVSVDLSPYAGKRVTLRLENAAGGARGWAWEAGYWAKVDVSGE